MYTSSQKNAKDISNAARNLRNEAEESVVEIKDDLRDVANKAGRKVRNFIDTASGEVTHARDVVTDHVKAKPVQSAAIALGAGFLLGMLFRR